MASSYEYIISLQDKMSGTMNKIIGTSGTVVSCLETMSKKQKELQGTTGDLGGSIFSLKQKIDLLQTEKELIPASNTTLIRKYNTEIQKLNGNIDRLNNQSGSGIRKWTNELTSAIPALKLITNPIVLVTAGIAKLTQAVSSGIEAWNQRAAAETRLSAIMRNTMNARDADVRSVLDLTSAQQKLGVVDAAAQTAGAQELSTYLSRRDSLEKLLPAMNDMLAQQYGLNATQEQAQNIASMMGKVMDGQTGALSRYGYKFTEAQERILKYGKETERATVLTQVIADSVGGVNAALAATPEGKWKQHENEMGELMERVGKVAVGFRTTLSPVIESISALFEKLVGWFEQNGEALSIFLNKITAAVSFALKGVFKTLKGIVKLFFWWWDALNTGNPIIWGLTAAIAATTIALNTHNIAAAATAMWDGIVAGKTWLLTAAQWALNAAFWANPLTWIVAGIAVLVGLIVMCVTKVQGWGKQWDVIVNFAKNLWELFCESFKFRWNLLTNGFMMGLDTIRLGWYKFKEAVGLGDSNENQKMISQISDDVEKRKQAITDGAKKIKDLTEKTKDSLTWELSWKKDETKKEKKTDKLTDFTNAPFNQFIDPVVNTQKGKDEKNTNEKIDLGNPVLDLKGSSAYSAIVSKLNPVRLASLATKAVAAVAIPAMLSTNMAAAIPGSPIKEKEFDAAKTEYVQEKDKNPVPVKIVDWSSSALALFPKSNNSVPKPVVNVTLPEPVTNISVPEPAVNVTLPEAITNINVPEPVTNINVPQPAVNVALPEAITNISVPQPVTNINVPQPAVNVALPEAITNISVPQPVTNINVPQSAVNVTLPEVITNISVPQPVTNINLPQPAVNVALPEAITNISVPQPVTNINVPQPAVNVALPEAITNISVPQPVANVTIPQSISLFELGETTDDSQNTITESKGRNNQIDRFCDQVVIHIANADSKGYEQIRSEVEKVLMDVLDDYGS